MQYGNIALQPFEVADFSGGMTDRYIGGPSNKFQTADNLLLLKYGEIGKLISRPGSVLFDSVNNQLPIGSARVGTLINFDFDSQLFIQSTVKLYYITTGWNLLQGPGSHDVFTTGDASNAVSSTQWNHHLFLTSDAFPSVMKIYKDDAGTFQVRNAGLPKLASNPTITSNNLASSNSYLYAFHYEYSYKVGQAPATADFANYGATTVMATKADVITGAGNQIAITNIPVITSGLENYDTANIKVYIYRSVINQTTLYLVGSISNGITSFNDSVTDANLIAGQQIYTLGGVLDNDPPPNAKFIHVAHNNICWYANVKEGVEYRSNRIRQSVPNAPDSCPGSFFVDLEEEITGINSINSIPIVFGKRGVYRLDGFFDLIGRGEIAYTKISDEGGCISNQSIIQTAHGLFWAGVEGFYFTDGFTVQKISEENTDSYRSAITTMTYQKRIVGAYDRNLGRIWWSMQKDASSAENDSCWILDLKWGVRPDMPFTTASGGTSFRPTSLCYFNNQILRADSRGYVFKHDMAYTNDPLINTSIVPTAWSTQTLTYNYVSCAFDFGTTYLRKWVPALLVSCKNLTNISLQITSNNDDGRITSNLVPIRFRNNLKWGDANVTWGDAGIIWNYSGLIEDRRRFPAGGMRCNYKQIGLTNASIIVTESDTVGLAVVDPVAKTATLANSNAAWPQDCSTYTVSFQNDNYVKQYPILSRTDSTLSLQDSSGTLPTGPVKWQISGTTKDEQLELISYCIQFALMTATQDGFVAGTTGANQ